MMDDLDRILDELAKATERYQRIAWGIVALLVALILWWMVRNDAGRPEVSGKITEIKVGAEVAERRVDAIVDAVKSKEEAIRDETVKQVQAVSDDALPDILAGLLRDYREGK